MSAVGPTRTSGDVGFRAAVEGIADVKSDERQQDPRWISDRLKRPAGRAREAKYPDATGLIARYKGVSDTKPRQEEIDEAEPQEYFGRDR